MKHCIFINQFVTHLFVDIINDFVSRGVRTELITGAIHTTHPLSENVKVKYFTAYNRKSTWTRLLTWHLFGFQVFLYLLFRKSPLFLTTNPPFLPVIAWMIRKIRRQPIYILYYDLYPEALERMGYLTPNNLIYKCWNWANRKVLKSADHLFTISESLKTNLLKHEVDAEKIHVVHSWVDNRYIKPLDKADNPFVKQQDLLEKFVILYSGNLGLTHDLESLVEAAARFSGHDSIQFVIIGEGTKKQRIMEMIQEKELKNSIVLPWQPPEALPHTFASADIGVVTLGEGAEGFSVPSKTYAYLAAGAALLVIANKNSELGRLVTEYECGEIFSPGDVQGIYTYVKKLYTNPDILSTYKMNARIASHDFKPENARTFYRILHPDTTG